MRKIALLVIEMEARVETLRASGKPLMALELEIWLEQLKACFVEPLPVKRNVKELV